MRPRLGVHPQCATLTSALSAKPDVVLALFEQRADLVHQLGQLHEALEAGGTLWVRDPKLTANADRDLQRDVSGSSRSRAAQTRSRKWPSSPSGRDPFEAPRRRPVPPASAGKMSAGLMIPALRSRVSARRGDRSAWAEGRAPRSAARVLLGGFPQRVHFSQLHICQPSPLAGGPCLDVGEAAAEAGIGLA